jgi:uracil-DNA glycosylase
MEYRFPFGSILHPLVQEDRTSKQIFVLGVYASAVHARWKQGSKVICQALAVASEPRIFWDGDPEEAAEIISGIPFPPELGYLEPAGQQLNGPSAKVLEEHILAPLGFTRQEAWLCDLLPETRLNPGQLKAIREKYEPVRQAYGLNPVTIPKRPSSFCNPSRAAEITEELAQSEAALLVLLGDIPIREYLNRVADVEFTSLQEYTRRYGYGTPVEVSIGGRTIRVLPLAHPRQIGALGAHSEKWCALHREWEKTRL